MYGLRRCFVSCPLANEGLLGIRDAFIYTINIFARTYICTHACMHATYIHKNMCAYIQTSMHNFFVCMYERDSARVRARKFVCVRVCVCAYVYTCDNTHSLTHTRTHALSLSDPLSHARTHTYMHTHTYTNAHTHTHTHTHTHYTSNVQNTHSTPRIHQRLYMHVLVCTSVHLHTHMTCTYAYQGTPYVSTHLCVCKYVFLYTHMK